MGRPKGSKNKKTLAKAGGTRGTKRSASVAKKVIKKLVARNRAPRKEAVYSIGLQVPEQNLASVVKPLVNALVGLVEVLTAATKKEAKLDTPTNTEALVKAAVKEADTSFPAAAPKKSRPKLPKNIEEAKLPVHMTDETELEDDTEELQDTSVDDLLEE